MSEYGREPEPPVDIERLAARLRRADHWDAAADERERLADEREALADEREGLADERERLADRHDLLLDRRETDAHMYGAAESINRTAEVLAAHAALDRAREAMRRAEAQVLRASQAAARADASFARHLDGNARAAANLKTDQAADEQDRAWLADRRDFVAGERRQLTDERETIADERDATANMRERLADKRDHDAMEREQFLDRPDDNSGFAGPVSPPTPPYEELRDKAKRHRQSSAARRHLAAADRTEAMARWGPETYGPMLLASFAQLAQQLFGSGDLSDGLPQVLKTAVGAVSGCDWASITIWRRDHAIDTVASNVIAAELDDFQFGTATGPCPEAMNNARPVYVPDLAVATQWPALGATAAQLGVSSALCHGLFVHHGARWSALGTLSFYSATPDAFSDEDHEFASILTSFIAVAVGMAQRHEDLERREAALHRGLSTRDVIGQAKGILMERQRLSAGDAFDILRRASQRLNRKLGEIAQQLADTGELPQ